MHFLSNNDKLSIQNFISAKLIPRLSSILKKIFNNTGKCFENDVEYKEIKFASISYDIMYLFLAWTVESFALRGRLSLDTS